MQRKTNISSQTSVTDMHFAVVPYQVQYLVPNDQIYQIYFQKGLQILGTTQYPIENHQKLKRIQLPILNNIIPFRLFSDKNAQYQWSIYKRINNMQEFLESKKINLKDILKKQPQKRMQNEKKNQTERKQSMGSRRNETKSSDLKATGAKTSEFKPSEPKSNELKTFDQNAAERLSEVSVEGKGCIYDQQVKSEMGQFILKFYLFRAFSKQELSKTIQEKSRQKKQVRAPLSQISVNKISELPKVSQIQPKVQQEPQKEENLAQKPEEIKEEDLQIYPTLLQAQKIDKGVEQIKLQQAKQQPEQYAIKQNQKIESRQQEKIETLQVQQEQKPVVLEGSSKGIQQSPIHAEKQTEQQPVITQVPSLGQQSLNEPTQTVTTKAPFVFSMRKKMFVVGLVLMILLYVLYSMNVFEKLSLPQNVTVPPKKQKKQKFSNRKKISK